MEIKDFESGELLTASYLTLSSTHDIKKTVYLSSDRINHKFRMALITEDDYSPQEVYKVCLAYSPSVQIHLGFLCENFLRHNYPKSLAKLEERIVSA